MGKIVCGRPGRHSSQPMDIHPHPPLPDGPPPGDALEREAWAWLRRLNGGDVRAWDVDGFKRWLRTSPAHQAAFGAARQKWALFEPAAGELLRLDPRAAVHHQATVRGPVLQRRAFLGAAASVAVVVGTAAVYRTGWLAPADDQTATGEQRRLALAGGTSLTLNTQTRIRRRMAGEDVVGIDLLSGEAAIDLSSSGGRGFAVVAGIGRSEADNGRFEVRHLDGRTCVTCIDGRVRVAHPAGARELRAGQQAVYDGTSLSAIAGVDAARVSAWRQGELVFERTPLAQVVTEINRYRPGRVVLMDAAAGQQPVSGSFDIAMLDLALAQLALSFDLHGRSLPGGLYLLS